MNRHDALTGALVADAAAMGLHWIYDQPHLQDLEKAGDLLFREPDAAVYADRKAFFAHAGRPAGAFSQYGESARLVGELALNDTYSTDKHRERFFASFGPCGSFVGYPDRPTKALIARMIIDGDDIADASGSDDDQMPALCAVPGLFAAGSSRQSVSDAVSVISINGDAHLAALAVFDVLEQLSNGVSLTTALHAIATDFPGPIGESLRAALAEDTYTPLAITERFGLACHVFQGLPVIWHLLAHTQDFETTVRDNIRCGGDTCGRSMGLGAIAGLALGIPDTLKQRLAPGALRH